MLLHTKLNNSQMYFRNIPIDYHGPIKQVPVTSGHVLQGNNVNCTKKKDLEEYLEICGQ